MGNKMNRCVLQSAAVLIGICATEAFAQGATRPNILMILTDDQGYGDLSLHGNPYIKTPHIDRIGQEGVRFDRFYVNSVCAPSRASLLTGRYAVRAGTHNVTNNREALRPGEVTFGNAFQQAGYRTSYIGKWHNGSQYPNTPQGKGFDEFFGFTGGHINKYFDAVLVRGTREEKAAGFITDVLTDEALRFIGENHKAPFLCYLNYNAPHDPYQTPDLYYDRMTAQGLEPAAAAHLAMCENIDDNVGRLLAQLDRLSIADNTIVLFLTDNGAARHAAQVYNAGMRGWKTSTHEGGTRVPLFIRWPRADWTPRIIETLVQHIDLYPTLTDLCGVEMILGPPVDGVSLRPLLENPQADWPDRILFTHNGIDESNRYPGSVRTPQYRLVCRIDGPQAGSQSKNKDETVTPWELYDMTNDPGETADISSMHPEVVQHLAERYEAWVDDLFSDPPMRWPIPVGHDEHNPVRLHASQAYFSSSIHYQVGGFANDWLTGWTDIDGEIWFEIESEEAGRYEIEIAYTCSEEDAGSQLHVRCGDSSVSAFVHAAPPVDILLPNRDSWSNERYRNREWGLLKAGVIDLPSGFSTISIRAVSKPGANVMDFKHLSLRKIN